MFTLIYCLVALRYSSHFAEVNERIAWLILRNDKTLRKSCEVEATHDAQQLATTPQRLTTMSLFKDVQTLHLQLQCATHGTNLH